MTLYDNNKRAFARITRCRIRMRRTGAHADMRTNFALMLAARKKNGNMGVTSVRGGRIFSESRQQMKNDAFERLFKKYYNEAKLYVTALSRNEALAEDIVSESFVKAFNLIDEEKESFKFWLLKVCRNAYFDYLKKARRLAPVHDNMRGGDADLAEKVIEDEEYRALYRAIALLKDNYREVILLYYFDELSVSEIAGITGQTVQNVKVLMYRARMKLKEILED